MKKLNTQGFTLVELLAVIIILAIVVGFTIPAILTTTKKAKAKAFANSAVATADWIDRQYQAMNTDLEDSGVATINPAFKDAMDVYDTQNGLLLDPTDSGSFGDMSKRFIYASGINFDNLDRLHFYINGSGRACVTLTASSNGDYAGVGNIGENNNQVKGGAC